MSQLVELVKMVAGSDGGAFAVVAVACLLVLWLYGRFVRLACKVDETSRRAKDAEERTDTACERLDRKVEMLGADLRRMGDDIQYVKSTLNRLVYAGKFTVVLHPAAAAPTAQA